jgi:restriction system protein
VRFVWELVPLGLLALGLVIVLGQRAVIGAQRYATELPWLPPLILVAVGLLSIAGATFWLIGHLRARRLAAQERAAWLEQIRTLAGLRALEPEGFESAVGELLRALGYGEVAHTGGGGDLCADLTCATARGELVVVQCKRYGVRRRVSSPEIQQFLGMMTIHHRAQRGLYVTTSSYTRQALALAQRHAPAIELIDGERLVELMQGVR